MARREGPSAQAESWLRYAFESGLDDLRQHPTLHDQQATVGNHGLEDGLGWLTVAQPFGPWFEYLVMFGRFEEARAVRARAKDVLGPGLVARPRSRIKALVETLASMATADVFQRALHPDFLPRLAADGEVSELRVSRFESPMLETICVALPVPLFNREPLWFAFARVPGTTAVRIFTMEWLADEFAARPAAWTRNDIYAPRTYGPTLAAGAAPRPDLGPTSPYLPAFLAFIGQEMVPLHAPIPTLAPPFSLPPVRSLAPAPAPSRRRSALVLAVVLALAGVLSISAASVWQLRKSSYARRMTSADALP
ncbi:MAG: hypothetical protein U0270_07405 [Labilithrix sp.]